jgi:pimeloyl-ACP methyl ester carboxylesterase
MSETTRELPFDGELHTADSPKFKETIIFVHHFGGGKKTVLRHAAMVNEFGFNFVRFTLSFNQALPSKLLPINADLKFGARHLWCDQIESILNAVPGKKIIYSFSMPSNSALEAIARRHAKDVVGWICDGGPFLELPKCIWNLYENQYKIESRLMRGVYTALSLALYGFGFPKEAPLLFSKLPADFPILSFRGEKDLLVPPSAINELFSLAKRSKLELDLDAVLIKNGGHLDGLKLEPEFYRKTVEKFLRKVATPIKSDVQP